MEFFLELVIENKKKRGTQMSKSTFKYEIQNIINQSDNNSTRNVDTNLTPHNLILDIELTLIYLVYFFFIFFQ